MWLNYEIYQSAKVFDISVIKMFCLLTLILYKEIISSEMAYL